MTRVIAAVVVTASVVVATTATARWWWDRREDCRSRHIAGVTRHDSDELEGPTTATATAYEALIGNTPLVKLQRLSNLTQRKIYVKMESLNPGGTGKDRAALGMILAAERAGELPPPIMRKFNDTDEGRGSRDPRSDDATNKSGATIATRALVDVVGQNGHTAADDPLDASILEALGHSRTGGLVVEGTSGSTGISLATIAASRGHGCLVVMPDDQAVEKQQILRALHAVVHVVPTAAIAHPFHYVNVARRLATRARARFHAHATFCDQFENPANVAVHYRTTGPEIYRQCRQQQKATAAEPQCGSTDNSNNNNSTVDSSSIANSDVISAFCMSSGTGGTIAGVGRYLKERTGGQVEVLLVDPPGSVLYNAIVHGVAYTSQQQERTIRRHRYDTLAEGIGLDRLTANFQWGRDCIDDAVLVTDQEAVDMAHWLLHNEGLWVGSSSAMNVVGAVRAIVRQQLPVDSTIVTIVCDTGSRHVTRFWNPEFIRSWGLQWPGDNDTSIKNDKNLPACLREVLASLPATTGDS